MFLKEYVDKIGLMNLEKILSFLLYFVPVALISSTFLSDLSISLASLLFIFLCISKKKWDYFKNKLFFFFIIWNVYLILNSLFSKNILLSLESSLFYFRFGFFTLAIWYIIENNKFFLKNIYYVFLITLIFVIVDGYLQFFVGKNIFGFEYDGTRLSGIFGDEKILGSFLSRTLPIFFGLTILLYSKKKFYIIYSLILLVLVDVLIYITGERTAFFNLLLFSLIIIIFTNKWKLIRLITIIISSIFILFISNINTGTYERMISKTIQQIYYLNHSDILKSKPNIFSIQHQVVYESAFKIFLDHPVFGIGPKMFREICNNEKYQVFADEDRSIDGCQTHPHNFMLQLITETGIIGLFPVITVFLLSVFYLLTNFFMTLFRKPVILSDEKIMFMSAIIINLWPFVPSGNFFNNYLSILIYFPLGFLVYLVYFKRKSFN